MITIPVALKSAPYNIYVGDNLIRLCAPLIAPFVHSKRVAIVSDSNTAPLYMERAVAAVTEAGGVAIEIVIEAGEEHKTLSTVEYICSRAMENSFTRSDVCLALGGGVVGDMTALAASLITRGVKLIAMPTTLLAQVDSSIGGKTGVNLECGKNLIGTFHQPSIVISDTSVLSTLPPREWRCGMAEVIKCAAIRDASLCEETDTEKIIARCAKIKSDIVCEDEFDRGVRMLLNFGHTIGHAVEKAAGYGTYSHGEAVAIGMYAMCAYGEREGISVSGTAEKLRTECEKAQLGVEIENLSSMIGAAMHDKKRDGDELNIVLLKHFGEGFVKKIAINTLTDVVR